MKYFLLSIINFASQYCFSYDPKKCFSVTHGDGLIKYDYPGYLSSEYMTKKYGTTGGTYESSAQSATASADPSVTSGRITSTVQFSTSSEGGCSYYSYQREERLKYIARNSDAILESVALGKGEHIESLYFYHSCENGYLREFKKTLQSNYGTLRMTRDNDGLDQQMIQIIRSDYNLRKVCQS